MLAETKMSEQYEGGSIEGGSKEDRKRAKVFRDFQRAYDYKRDWLVEAEEDYQFTFGVQWDEKDVQALEAKGKPALTINKIRPNIQLLVGIESQNRSDFKAFPEGAEDSIKAEIATALLKNAVKRSEAEYKISEAFEDGLICGEGWAELYLDYMRNPLFGEMKLKVSDYNQWFPDPDAKEYDLSDAQYVCKVTYGLNRDQVLMLYPELEDKIDDIGDGSLNMDRLVGGDAMARSRAPEEPSYQNGKTNVDGQSNEEKTYDLLEYYYNKMVKKFWVADYKLGLKEVASKEEGVNYIEAMKAVAKPGDAPAELISRNVPEKWVCSFIGSELVAEERAWYAPRWSGWPVVRIMSYWKHMPVSFHNQEILVQGITRGMKSLQQELNKRRSQELHILNTSANSGWLAPQGSFTDLDKVEKLGSSPGTVLEYDPAAGPPPEKQLPTPLSQGHAQMAAEHGADMKESAGINAEQLALESGERSGRAIALRQKQGLVMVQKLFDNLSRSKKTIGKFILSQLSAIYDVDSAIRVLGDAYIKEHFSVPVMAPGIDPMTGQPGMIPQLDPNTGELAMQIDTEAVANTFNAVLNDAELGVYDVAIAEAAMSETFKFANFETVKEMAAAGVPVPPDVLIEESTISEGSKRKIVAAIQNMQAAQAKEPPKGAKK